MGRVVITCIALAVLVLACAPEPPATEPVARGRQMYRSLGCANCHEANLIGQRLGPTLDHIGTVAADVVQQAHSAGIGQEAGIVARVPDLDRVDPAGHVGRHLVAREQRVGDDGEGRRLPRLLDELARRARIDPPAKA